MTTRRGFLRSVGAAAAAMMVPTVALRQTIDAERLMAAFCGTDVYSRFDIGSPFFQKGLTFATDSRAMIVGDIGTPNVIGERRLPDAIGVIESCWDPRAKFVPLSELDLTPTIRRDDFGLCPECGNRQIPYPEESEWPDDPYAAHRMRFDVDDSTMGDPSCKVCNGQPYEGPTLVNVCGVTHSAWYLKRVAAIPDVEVAMVTARVRSYAHLSGHCIQFRSEQFRGLSLGVSPE